MRHAKNPDVDVAAVNPLKHLQLIECMVALSKRHSSAASDARFSPADSRGCRYACVENAMRMRKFPSPEPNAVYRNTVFGSLAPVALWSKFYSSAGSNPGFLQWAFIV